MQGRETTARVSINRTDQQQLRQHEDLAALGEEHLDGDRRNTRVRRRPEDPGVRREKAVQLRRQRAGHLGDVKKKFQVVKQLLNDDIDLETINRELQSYERAFFEFVNIHEQYLEFEDDETIKGLMIESYENQRDLKYEIELLFKKSNTGRDADISLHVSGEFGSKIVSSKEGSRVSSRTNVSSSRRMVEEANLKIKELHQRQIIERQLEKTEADYERHTREMEQEKKFKKAELERKLEVLKAESKLKRAVTFLELEEGNSSRSSDSLNGKGIPYRSSNLSPNLESKSERFSRKPQSSNLPQPASRVQQSNSFMDYEAHAPAAEATSVPVVNQLPFDSVQPPSFTNNPRFQYFGLGGPDAPYISPFSYIPAGPQGFPVNYSHNVPVSTPRFQVDHSFPPDLVDVPDVPFTDQVNPAPQVRLEPAEFHPNRRQTRNLQREGTTQDEEPWIKIADAIRQGPSLPKIDLFTFAGDPLEFSEFVTNFRDNIESQIYDDSQRLTRLLAQCSGKAKEAIRSCVSLPVGTRYDTAWRTLKQNFGQPYMVAEAHIRRLQQKQLKKADASSLMDFSRCLVDAQRTLSNLGPSFMNRLNHEDLIITLMNKLPDDSMKRAWAHKAGDLIKLNDEVKYSDFSDFVQKTAERLNNRFAQELKSIRLEKQSHKRVNAYVMQNKDAKIRLRCPSCSGSHGVWRCPIFKACTLIEKQSIVNQERLCRRCLEKGHFAASCKRKFFCLKKGCGKEHHWLLHPEDEGQTKRNVDDRAGRKLERSHNESKIPPKVDHDDVGNLSNAETTVALTGAGHPKVCFKVVPVRIQSPKGGKEITTYAFLDSGSDSTLCLDSLVDELGLENKEVNYTMITMSDTQLRKGRLVNLQVSSLDGDSMFEFDNVLTTDRLSITTKHLATEEQISSWPHLKGIHLPQINDRRVKLLIGMDRPDVIENDVEKRRGRTGEPYAVRTPLGWTVCGPVTEDSEDESDDAHINFARTDRGTINEQLEHIYNAEFGDVLGDTSPSLSIEDQKAARIMKESAQLVDGHYQVRLPFHHEAPKLPDNHKIAAKRLDLLKKRFAKDDRLREQYTAVMKKYEEEGAAKIISDKELITLTPIWFLPHHAVYHPKKPDEPRIVFDCASECDGTSLNHELLQGPDNTSSLIGVLLRFRVEEVAVAADIKRMFHQVFVAPEHRGALCYLWWPGGNLREEPKPHQMLVHLFGAKSSPSVAGYALRRTADDNKHEFPCEVIDTVYKDFYVDDLLKSFPDIQHAITVSKQLQQLLHKGGFHLTKWISNSREVVAAFPEDERAPIIEDMDMNFDKLPTDKALGVHWDIEEDKFKLLTNKKQYQQNRKGVLSSIASIYDPLGFSCPLILPGKEINQELCRLKYSWEEELPPDLANRWDQWKTALANLEDYGIPRCFKPRKFGNVAFIELHNFSDASENHGYGVVSYLRLVNDRDQIHCSFVMSKSRVKPLKAGITIPKLELTAATLAVTMSGLITKELDGRLRIDRIYFWTDSYLVLRYIHNEKKRFTKFVANRVAVIREGSEPDQWNYVQSELNPADCVSRGLHAREELKLKAWREGPVFLWKNREQWPQQPQEIRTELTEADFGVRKEITTHTTISREEFWKWLLGRYSTWRRLFRIVAWLIKACRKFRSVRSGRVSATSQARPDSISMQDQATAKEKILQCVQQESFSKEISTIKSSPKFKGNGLAKLKPFLHNGILRVGGRLKYSDLEFDTKHPIIIPGKHHVTEKIIYHYHTQNGHVGTHQTLAETRRRFWILKGVASVRRVLKNCHECKRQSAKRGEQIIAHLPPIRVSKDNADVAYPFAAVGIDYFGPFYITRGKSTRSARTMSTTHKRYGCIFTCLRYRAVHIEVVSDLSTDSFIQAVFRFVARRGPPLIIYSDNGTNFRGAELDILDAMKRWNQEQITSTLQKKEIERRFNPPAASHYGGVWERLIRSIRRILHSMIGEQLVNEETLMTFLIEVEKIMNDRPITPVPNESEDLLALTHDNK